MVITWSILIIQFFYFLFLYILIYGWKRLPSTKTDYNFSHFISVIIPVRNEEANISRLLQSLESQRYPADRFEAIIIDDNSTDHTIDIIKNYIHNTGLDLHLYQVPESTNKHLSPKKRNITYGVEKSRGTVIVLIDGDCRADKNWLVRIENTFRSRDPQMIAGPVFIDPEDTFSGQLQSVEFTSLIGTGAALIYWNLPVMCNGANLAFRKSAFKEVDGYTGNENIISGDDEFLMYKINKRYPGKIAFLKSADANVITRSQRNIPDFISQRKRWAGKWKRHVNKRTVILALFIFIVHLSFLLAVLTAITGNLNLFYFFGIVIVKVFMEYFFINRIFNELNKRMKVIPFVICSLFYSFYAVIFGILANYGSYSWKDRIFKA